MDSYRSGKYSRPHNNNVIYDLKIIVDADCPACALHISNVTLYMYSTWPEVFELIEFVPQVAHDTDTYATSSISP